LNEDRSSTTTLGWWAANLAAQTFMAEFDE
jgi:hypothetical protein